MKSKNFGSIFLIIAFVAIGIYQYRKYNVAPKIAFPNLSLTDLNGQAVNWNSIQKPVFINFFGTWCVDCKKEMPDLAILYSQFQKENIDLILISDEPIEVLNKYKNATALPMKIYHSNSPLTDIGIHTYPTSYLINKEQEIVYQATNIQDWTSEKLKSTLLEAVK